MTPWAGLRMNYAREAIAKGLVQCDSVVVIDNGPNDEHSWGRFLVAADAVLDALKRASFEVRDSRTPSPSGSATTSTDSITLRYPTVPPRYLTTAEAANYLRCSKQRIYDLTNQKKLPVHKDGARNLYRRDELDEYLSGGST